MIFQELIEEVRHLPRDQQRLLLKLLEVSLAEDENQSVTQRSLLELAGLGADLWQGIDTEEYVSNLRDEWEERSW